MKKAIITAGSRGIGKAIADSLSGICDDVVATSSQELDTSDLDQVNNFIKNNSTTDILVLNTGGPPAKLFNDISEDDWNKYHNQLFLSFCLMLQHIHVNDGGYIFLISSFNIKEPDPKLILSNSYRIAMTSVLKSLSKSFADRDIACINIAPGPIKTDLIRGVTDKQIRNITDQQIFNKTMTPNDIVDIVKLLLSEGSKHISGQSLAVGGS